MHTQKSIRTEVMKRRRKEGPDPECVWEKEGDLSSWIFIVFDLHTYKNKNSAEPFASKPRLLFSPFVKNANVSKHGPNNNTDFMYVYYHSCNR